MAKKYYFLKLNDDFFASKEIKRLRKLAGGDTYVIIYLKMQLLSLKNEGKLFYEGFDDSFCDELAMDLDEEPDNVSVTINFLIKHGLLQEITDEEYLLPGVINNISSEGSSAARMRKLREKRKASQCDNNVTLQCNANVTDVTNCNKKCDVDIDIDIEKDIDIDIEKDIDIDIEKDIDIDIDIEQQHRENCYTKIIDVVGCTLKEASVIFNVAKKQFPDKDVVVVVKEKFDIVKKLKYENLVGALIAAIKEDWQPSIYKNSSKVSSKNGFNNFKARDYDYEKLERQLLGWETDEGGD